MPERFRGFTTRRYINPLPLPYLYVTQAISALAELLVFEASVDAVNTFKGCLVSRPETCLSRRLPRV